MMHQLFDLDSAVSIKRCGLSGLCFTRTPSPLGFCHHLCPVLAFALTRVVVLVLVRAQEEPKQNRSQAAREHRDKVAAERQQELIEKQAAKEAARAASPLRSPRATTSAWARDQSPSRSQAAKEAREEERRLQKAERARFEEEERQRDGELVSRSRSVSVLMQFLAYVINSLADSLGATCPPNVGLVSLALDVEFTPGLIRLHCCLQGPQLESVSRRADPEGAGRRWHDRPSLQRRRRTFIPLFLSLLAGVQVLSCCAWLFPLQSKKELTLHARSKAFK